MQTNPVTSGPMPALYDVLPNSKTPWMMSPGLFERVQMADDLKGYKKCEILNSDLEWAFILRYFEWQKPVGRCIKKAYCVHEGIRKSRNPFLNFLENRRETGVKIGFKNIT